MTFAKACKIDEIKEGEGKIVKIGDVTLAIFNDDGRFYAVQNNCPHRGGPLGEGIAEGGVVTCPWHGWRFNLTTGKNTIMPVSIKTYSVMVEGDHVLVDL